MHEYAVQLLLHLIRLQCTTGWANLVTCKNRQQNQSELSVVAGESSGAVIKEAPDASPLSPSKAFQLHPISPSKRPYDRTRAFSIHFALLDSCLSPTLNPPFPVHPVDAHPSPSESCASWSHHKSCPLLPTPSRSPFPSLSGIHQALSIVPWAVFLMSLGESRHFL